MAWQFYESMIYLFKKICFHKYFDYNIISIHNLMYYYIKVILKKNWFSVLEQNYKLGIVQIARSDHRDLLHRHYIIGVEQV